MRNLSLLTVTLGLAVLFFACKKEMSFEEGEPSHGSLQSSAGNCLPKSVNGTYRVNQVLGDTNSIDVTVSVTQIGAFVISTDTLNGYYFRAVGNFAGTGTQTVNLKGFGKPATTGVNTFTVKYDSSVCTVPVTVVAATTTTTTGSAFTLLGTGGNCMNATVSGTYTQSVVLTSANTVAIQINVTTVGPWTLNTNSVTGFSFTSAGTFTATGPQIITLTGSGTPTTAGSQTFTVSAGNTTCTFTVTVGAPTPPSTDHFIITDNSWWSYSTPLPAPDTLKRSILPGSFNASGFSYKGMKEINAGGQLDDTLYFRKSSNVYYEFNYVDYYTSFYLDQLITDSLLFLKEGLNTNDTWKSAVYSGTEQGQPRQIRYDYTCLNSNATVTLNGRTYTNVYQVQLKVMVDKGTGFAPDITWTNYYAQGIGWIYQKYDDGQSVYDFPIRYYQVF